MNISELKFSIPHLVVVRMLPLQNPSPSVGDISLSALVGLRALTQVGPLVVACGPDAWGAGAGQGIGLGALAEPPCPRPALVQNMALASKQWLPLHSGASL